MIDRASELGKKESRPMLTIGDTLPDFALQSVVSLEKGKEFQEITSQSYPAQWLVGRYLADCRRDRLAHVGAHRAVQKQLVEPFHESFGVAGIRQKRR